MPQPLVCTVLPTYNERDNIAVLVRGILHHATTRHVVIVVDDDSPDGTADVVAELAAKLNPPATRDIEWLTGHGKYIEAADVGTPAKHAGLPLLHLERRTHDRGLTSAIRHGIHVAIDQFDADIVTWMDCDLSMPPADVPRLVQAIEQEGADIAVGSRWAPGGADIAHTRMAKTLSRLINLYAQALIGGGVRDFTSGFIAARAQVLRGLPLHGDYGEYCIDLLGQAVRQGLRITEVPYVCVPRNSGDSKTGATLWDYLVKGRKYVAAGWRQARFRPRRRLPVH
jgi:dolichol-phosphate mannosyltransferase